MLPPGLIEYFYAKCACGIGSGCWAAQPFALAAGAHVVLPIVALVSVAPSNPVEGIAAPDSEVRFQFSPSTPTQSTS